MEGSKSTRERLLTAAVDLFAARGFDRTTIAAIEEGAGLSPGAGGMYRHFASKQELIEAALAPIADSVHQLEQARQLLPLGELRSELTLLARGGLAGIAASRPLLRVIERDPDIVPELKDRARTEVLERGYSITAEVIVALVDAHGLPQPADPAVLARMAIGTLTNHLRETEIYGTSTQDLEDRLIEAWVDVFHTYLVSPRRGAG